MEKSAVKILSKKDWAQIIALGILMMVFMNLAGQYFWREVWFVAEIFVLTFLTRTVLWRTGLSVFWKGFYIGGGLTLIFNGLIAVVFPDRNYSVFLSGFVVGFSEELFKILPVILVAYAYGKNGRRMNISDWTWLAVLSGTAFGLSEKIFYENVTFPFTYGPSISFLHFFPDALGVYAYGEELGYIGHGAATGLVGLCIGIGLVLKHKMGELSKWWFGLWLAGYVWVSLEHAFGNGYYVNGSQAWLSLGGGQITPYLFLILFAAGLFLDGSCLKKYLEANPKIHKDVLHKVKQLPSLFGKNIVLGFKALWLFVWTWRATNYLSSKQNA